MNLIEHELVDRYIYYYLRYIPYDRQDEAKENMIKMLEEKLPIEYTDSDIANALNKLGNPYQFASSYTNTGHFLISGKNYEIFIEFLKMLALSSLIGLVLFFFNYFNRLAHASFFTVLKTLAISIFILSILPSWVSEKIKTNRVLKSLTSEWDISRLYDSKKLKIEAIKIILMIINYSMFFMLQIYIITSKIDITTATYTFIMILFFLNVLKDNLKISENNLYSRVMYVEYFVDIFTILSFSILTKFYIPDIFIIKTIMFTNFVNLLIYSYRIIKDKRNSNKRSNRARKRDRKN